ncbi:MAG: hypothetical protein HQL91_08340 [Magnetococcales bacterium]|nr:hypothetical protein [Magnetococcales bacterium]
MSRFPPFARLLLVILLCMASAPPGLAALEQHEHNGTTPRNESGLSLDNGKPWQTDAPLRKGMEAIQRDIQDALPRIRAGSQTPRQYAALARKMHNHVHHVTKYCKLPPKADSQLHLVLGEVLQGAEAMEAQNGQSSGAAMIVHALDLYGRHFDHAGWKPLDH